MNDTARLVTYIIKEQAAIIGPVAWQEAEKVSGLRIDINNHEVHLEGNPREVLEKLVTQYERLFGKASREVCRDAVRPYVAQISPDQLPEVLR